MRSIKSELYLLIKTALLGGTYTDENGTDYTFTAIDTVATVNFWNSQLINYETIDNYKLNAVFFEITTVPRTTIQLRTSEFNNRANSKDNVQFSLHIVTGKQRAENSDADYLDALDLAEAIYNRVQGLRILGIQGIYKIDESSDPNSQTLTDYTITFEAEVTNCGSGDTIDARTDPAPATIPFTVGVTLDDPGEHLKK